MKLLTVLILATLVAGIVSAVSGGGKPSGAADQAGAATPRPRVWMSTRPEAHPTPSAASRTRRSLVPGRRSHHALNWRALFLCESGNNPRAVSASGKYRGLAQFDLSTWHSVGGRGDPINASRAEQTYRAQLLYADRGRTPWPVCGRRL